MSPTSVQCTFVSTFKRNVTWNPSVPDSGWILNASALKNWKPRKWIQLGAQFCSIYLFISLLYMFRASMCPSSGEKLLYLCDTGICHSGWVASGLQVGFEQLLNYWTVSIQPGDQTPPIQSDKYKCRVDKIIFLLMMCTWMPGSCREK
jgi:hypothetical protein